MLTIGTGIGGGLILDGQLYRGSTGAAGELGHIVIEADGPPCQGNCPNRGCVEALASGTAIAREGLGGGRAPADSALGRALAAGERARRQAMVTDAALAGDETARGVLALVGRRIGVALSSLANTLDPDVIVIGGGAIRAGELLVGPAREELARPRPAADERDAGRGRGAGTGRRNDRRGDDGAALELEEASLSGGPADRLPDPDRQPRGPQPARPPGARARPTSSPARTPAAPAASTSGSTSRARGSSPTTRETRPSGPSSSPSRSSAGPGWC